MLFTSKNIIKRAYMSIGLKTETVESKNTEGEFSSPNFRG